MLVAGECLVDLAPATAPATASPAGGRPFAAMPGGSPANVAVGLARLGVPTAFAGRLSRRGFGPWLRQHLTANGVDVTPSVDASQPPTLAVVSLDELGRASYTFYGPETADWQWADDELPRDPGVAAVHTGSLAATLDPGASVLGRWLATLRSAGEVLISFDPNVRLWLVDDLGAYRRRLEEIVSNAHIVKASDEDIAAVYPGTDPAVVVDRWLAAGTSLVLVTEGGHGAYAAHSNGGRARCAPPRVAVVDTIGAGDSFTAGLLAYLAQEDLLTPAGTAGLSSAQIEAALQQAVAAGALTCTRAGADPPNREQLAAFLAQ
jgi:fructokinase